MTEITNAQGTKVSRREFLKRVGALAAGVLVPDGLHKKPDVEANLEQIRYRVTAEKVGEEDVPHSFSFFPDSMTDRENEEYPVRTHPVYAAFRLKDDGAHSSSAPNIEDRINSLKVYFDYDEAEFVLDPKLKKYVPSNAKARQQFLNDEGMSKRVLFAETLNADFVPLTTAFVRAVAIEEKFVGTTFEIRVPIGIFEREHGGLAYLLPYSGGHNTNTGALALYAEVVDPNRKGGYVRSEQTFYKAVVNKP